MSALSRRLKKYNITEEEYNAMIESSDGKCWICGRAPKTKALNIDHNHKTGRVRGLLCYLCNNKLIGKLGDSLNSPDLFYKAALYLENAGEGEIHHPDAKFGLS